MKRTLLMALLTLALPLTAFAGSSVDFTNVGGMLSGTSAGLTLSGSTLLAVNGLNGMGLKVGNLGSVSLTTGALLSGSLAGGGTFSGAGSSFVITGNGTDGVPNAVIFQGSFNGTVTWNLTTTANGTNIYTLSCEKSCSLSGTWINGSTVSGAMVSITLATGKGVNGEFNGSVALGSGDTTISTVPEPGTLGLLGTGLVGLAGALHRKFKS